MEELKEKIMHELKEKGVFSNYNLEVEEFLKRSPISSELPFKSLWNTFLLQMSESNKMFLNILKRSYIFDLVCEIECSKLKTTILNSEIKRKLINNFTNRVDYIEVCDINGIIKIGIKYNNNIYNDLKNVQVESYLIPYELLLFDDGIKITDFKFYNILFDYEKPKEIMKTYAEFIQHLQTLDLPLSISSDDLLYESTNILSVFDVYIYLQESSCWPKDLAAIDCAKSAFYCQMYLKSQYKHTISKNYVVFKFKNVFFKVKILIKSDFNIKYKVTMALHRVVKNKGEMFSRKVHLIKTLLAKLGYYPLIMDDFFVDVLCLIISKNIIGDEKFLCEFLNFNFKIENSTFDLETMKLYRCETQSRQNCFKLSYKNDTLNVALPSKEHMADIKESFSKLIIPQEGLFYSDFVLSTNNLLVLKYEDFDFVLSKKKLAGFDDIIGGISCAFDLGTPELREFLENNINKEMKCLYDPISKILYIKHVSGRENNFLRNILIYETGFEYLKEIK